MKIQTRVMITHDNYLMPHKDWNVREVRELKERIVCLQQRQKSMRRSYLELDVKIGVLKSRLVGGRVV